LLNATKRASIMAETDRLTCEDLGLPQPASADTAEGAASDLDLRAVRDAAERQAIVAALARSNNNIVKASEILGVSRPTLYDLMRRLSIK
jgi:two-component system NtrC family response regulator